MAPFTEAAADCRFLLKAAVRDTGRSEVRALGVADSAPLAKPDCRFPFADGPAAPLPASTDAAPVAAATLGPTGGGGLAVGPDLDPPPDGATSGHVARDVTNRDQGGGVDRPFSARAPGVPTPVSHHDQVGDMPPAKTRNHKGSEPEAAARGNGRPAARAAPPSDPSAGQPADGAEDVLVTWGGVDGGRVDALVPSDPLHEPDVARGAVGVGQGGVPERVEVEGTVEPGALLPEPKEVAQRPRGEAAVAPRDEERRIRLEALAARALPADELGELVPDAVGHEDLLGDRVLARPLEHAEGEPSPHAPVLVQDVADVERGDLVLAQPGAEGEREEHVVTEAVPVLAGDSKQDGLLGLGEGSGRAGDGVGVSGHEQPPASSDALVPPQSKSTRQSAPGPLLVVKRTEQDLLDWLGTELGFLTGIGHYNEEPIVFEPYQVAFLSSTKKYRWVEKARQVGFSFLFACEAIARCHLRDAHTSVMVSYNLEDAKEKVNYARQLAEELPLAFRKKIVTDSKTELGFLSNSAAKRVSRIISNPSKAPRGKKGDLYLDELAHYANDREVYKGSTALILRSRGQLTGCSSPLGRRGVFWEIARQELRQYRAYWRQQVPWWLCRFFSTDVARAAKEASMMPTEERVRAFGTKDIQDQFDSLLIEDFQQEFELAYCDESYSFFPYELILPCTSDDLVLADDFPALAEPKGRLVAGFDVGRKRDLSELAIFEEANGKKECRLIRSYDRVPFAEQEADLRRMLTLLPIARLSIDQNGLGMHLAENLRRDFPQVVPETFTNESKETWANDFKILLQRKDVVLPKDRELVAQTHSVKRRITPSGKPSFEVERDEVGRGHADRFWAVALACRKERGPLPGTVPEINVRVIG